MLVNRLNLRIVATVVACLAVCAVISCGGKDKDGDDDGGNGNGNGNGGGGGGKSITITGFNASANGDRIEIYLFTSFTTIVVGGGGPGKAVIQGGKATVSLNELTPPGNPWKGSGSYLIQLQLWKTGAANSYADLYYTGGGDISVITLATNPPKYNITADNTEIGFDKFGEPK